MDKNEAQDLLAARISQLRQFSYSELRRFFDEDIAEITGPSGQTYQIETRAVWDGAEAENIRVMVAIDDRGWRAFFPMSDDFIKAPDDSFVDE